MKRQPKPDKRTQRREAIKEALQTFDGQISNIEFVAEPSPLEDGTCWAEVWLYRKGTGIPPERVDALVHLEAKRVLRLEHPNCS